MHPRPASTSGSHSAYERASPVSSVARTTSNVETSANSGPYAAQRLVNNGFPTSLSPLVEDVRRKPIPRPALNGAQLKEKVAAVILAGGPSKNPLAQHTAMPAVPFGSNVRLIDVPIHNALNSGLSKVFVLTQFNSFQLHNYLSHTYPAAVMCGPGVQTFVDVLACNQTPDCTSWYRGSAEAVARNLEVISGAAVGQKRVEDYLILSGQAVYTMDFERLVAAHRCSGADVTLATYCVSEEDATRMGVVRTDPRTGTVSGFMEKPSVTALRNFAQESPRCSVDRPYEASLGIYVFKAEALERLLEPAVPGANPPAHFGHDVLPAALSDGMLVHAFNHRGFWKDVHRVRDYYDASLCLAAPHSPIPMQDMVVLQEAVPPTMMSNASLENVLLGDGSVLRGCTLKDVVLGKRSYVGEGSSMDGVVFLGSELLQSDAMREQMRAAGEPILGVGRNTVVERAVVDLNACIGDNVRLVNHEGIQEADRSKEGFVINDGIIVVLRNAVIPDGFHL